MKKCFLILVAVVFCGINGMAQTVADSIIAPNVFKPSGSGNNAVFEVKSEKDNLVSLKIYNRLGELVFSADAKKCRWDGNLPNGEKAPVGVYVYSAEILDITPKIKKVGDVTLLRD